MWRVVCAATSYTGFATYRNTPGIADGAFLSCTAGGAARRGLQHAQLSHIPAAQQLRRDRGPKHGELHVWSWSRLLLAGQVVGAACSLLVTASAMYIHSSDTATRCARSEGLVVVSQHCLGLLHCVASQLTALTGHGELGG